MIQVRFGAIWIPCILGCFAWCTVALCGGRSSDDDDYLRDDVDDARNNYINAPLAGRSNIVTKRINFLSAHMHSFDYQKEHDEQCSICCEPYENDLTKKIAELDCSGKHIFHMECLTEWIKRETVDGKAPDCPICRAPINLQA